MDIAELAEKLIATGMRLPSPRLLNHKCRQSPAVRLVWAIFQHTDRAFRLYDVLRVDDARFLHMALAATIW